MHLIHNKDQIIYWIYWSRDVTKLVDALTSIPAKSYAGQHDIALKFVNNKIFGNKGVFNREFRKAGGSYPDLVLPAGVPGDKQKIVELRLHTSKLKYLRAEINQLHETFSRADSLLFGYLLMRGWKREAKTLRRHACIFYLVVIEIPKVASGMPRDELTSMIKMGAQELVDKVKDECGIDDDDEELLGVDNMIKVVDLERRLEEKNRLLEEKDRVIEEKDRAIEEKDRAIEEKDRAIERLNRRLEERP